MLTLKLSGWWLGHPMPPLWKIWKSIGMTIPNISGKIKNGNQTTNQDYSFDIGYLMNLLR